MSKLVAPGGRPFKMSRPIEELTFVTDAAFKLKYRGTPLYKSAFDIVIFMQLIGALRPRTVIEVGTRLGGSALWFADMIRSFGDDARVYSVDLERPQDVSDPRVTFLQGDALRLGEVFTADFLAGLPRPWLISEDSAHTREVTSAVLDFFHPHLQVGDYIVVEDGMVEEVIEGFRVADGPNQAVHAFLTEHQGKYEIDAELCDFFGYNITTSPNGYIRRTA